MFDVFIIQKIRDEEERRRREEVERPRLEVPVPEVPEGFAIDEPREERGVLIIEPDEA